jgi:hypothetical protein
MTEVEVFLKEVARAQEWLVPSFGVRLGQELFRSTAYQ